MKDGIIYFIVFTVICILIAFASGPQQSGPYDPNLDGIGESGQCSFGSDCW